MAACLHAAIDAFPQRRAQELQQRRFEGGDGEVAVAGVQSRKHLHGLQRRELVQREVTAK